MENVFGSIGDQMQSKSKIGSFLDAKEGQKVDAFKEHVIILLTSRAMLLKDTS